MDAKAWETVEMANCCYLNVFEASVLAQKKKKKSLFVQIIIVFTYICRRPSAIGNHSVLIFSHIAQLRV